MTEQQQQLIEALNGAAQGISAAVDQGSITARRAQKTRVKSRFFCPHRISPRTPPSRHFSSPARFFHKKIQCNLGIA